MTENTVCGWKKAWMMTVAVKWDRPAVGGKNKSVFQLQSGSRADPEPAVMRHHSVKRYTFCWCVPRSLPPLCRSHGNSTNVATVSPWQLKACWHEKEKQVHIHLSHSLWSSGDKNYWNKHFLTIFYLNFIVRLVDYFDVIVLGVIIDYLIMIQYCLISLYHLFSAPGVLSLFVLYPPWWDTARLKVVCIRVPFLFFFTFFQKLTKSKSKSGNKMNPSLHFFEELWKTSSTMHKPDKQRLHQKWPPKHKGSL